jgi:hypothetical protein
VLHRALRIANIIECIAITALETVSPKLSRASLIRKMADVEARL